MGEPLAGSPNMQLCGTQEDIWFWRVLLVMSQRISDRLSWRGQKRQNKQFERLVAQCYLPTEPTVS